MEKIRLHNGKEIECLVIEHEHEKVYIPKNSVYVLDVMEVLQDLGNKCILQSKYSVSCKK